MEITLEHIDYSTYFFPEANSLFLVRVNSSMYYMIMLFPNPVAYTSDFVFAFVFSIDFQKK